MEFENLPEGWERCKLGDIFDLVGGGTPSTKSREYWGEGVPWISSADIDDGCNYSVRRKVTPTGVANSTTNVVGANTILVVTRVGLGKTTITKEQMCFSQDIQALIPKRTIEIRYVLLQLLVILNELKYQSRGTTINGITKKQLSDAIIILPPLKTQRKVSDKLEELLSELDKGISELAHVNKQINLYKQSYLCETYSCLLDYSHKSLGAIIESKPRNGYSPKGVYYETPYKNLTLTSTTGGKFKDGYFKYVDIDLDKDSYLWVNNNDILIQRANTIDYVGTAAIYEGPDAQYVYPDLMMKVHLIPGYNPKFIYYQLNMWNTRNYYRKNATGTAGSMPKINQKTVMETPIIVAPLAEQNRVVTEIESKFSVCENIEQTVSKSLQKAETLRQSILKQAFEGKLV